LAAVVIVNISSVVAIVPGNLVGYSASKAALIYAVVTFCSGAAAKFFECLLENQRYARQYH